MKPSERWQQHLQQSSCSISTWPSCQCAASDHAYSRHAGGLACSTARVVISQVKSQRRTYQPYCKCHGHLQPQPALPASGRNPGNLQQSHSSSKSGTAIRHMHTVWRSNGTRCTAGLRLNDMHVLLVSGRHVIYPGARSSPTYMPVVAQCTHAWVNALMRHDD